MHLQGTSFCINCGAPRSNLGSQDACSLCGLRPEESQAALGSNAWQHAYMAQLQQQARAASSSTDIKVGTTAQPAVVLACDERMLLHRGALPPHLER